MTTIETLDEHSLRDTTENIWSKERRQEQQHMKKKARLTPAYRKFMVLYAVMYVYAYCNANVQFDGGK